MKIKWNFDIKVAKIMNEIAEEVGVDTKQVREVLTCHMDSLKEALSDPQLPNVPLIRREIGTFKPVPHFMRRKIKILRIEGTEESIKWADELQIALDRVNREREFNKETLRKKDIKAKGIIAKLKSKDNGN